MSAGPGTQARYTLSARIGHLVGCPLLFDPTVHHDGGAGGHGQGRGHELLDQEDGHPLGGQGADQLVELVDDQRRQAHRQLVEQQDLGPGDQGPRDGQHLLLAPGEGAGHLLAPLLQTGEGGEGLLLDVSHADPAPVGPDAQVLAHGQVREDPTALGNGAHTPFDQLLTRALAHRRVPDQHLAGARSHPAADDLQQGRLSGSVGPEQGEHASRRHHQVDAVENLDPSVGSPDVADDDARREHVELVAWPCGPCGPCGPRGSCVGCIGCVGCV